MVDRVIEFNAVVRIGGQRWHGLGYVTWARVAEVAIASLAPVLVNSAMNSLAQASGAVSGTFTYLESCWIESVLSTEMPGGDAGRVRRQMVQRRADIAWIWKTTPPTSIDEDDIVDLGPREVSNG